MKGSDGKPVVYLHVGEPKSGTTFVQEVMWGNRDELARQGVLLPGAHAQDHFRANQDLREARQSADDPTGSYRGEWPLLVKQAMQADRAAVISHELLSAATKEQAAKAIESLAGAEVHIVLSLRDFDSLLPAEWQETVKHRNSMTWDQWIGRVMKAPGKGRKPGQARWFWRVHESIDLLGRWTQGIPPERVHIVTMPPPGSPPGLLWERFASVINVDPEPFDLGAARPNASLGLAEVEMLRRLNVALKDSEIGGWYYAVHVKERLAHGYLASRRGRLRPQMTAEQQAWARARCERVVEFLKSSNFQIAGNLDDLMPREVSESAMANRMEPEDVPLEDVVDAAIGSMAAVLHNRVSPPPPAPQELRLLDRGAARVGASPWLKRWLRDVSTHNRVVRGMRVSAWRISERSRARRKQR